MTELKIKVYEKSDYGNKEILIKELNFSDKEKAWSAFISFPNSLEQKHYYLDLIECFGSNENVINSKYITLSTINFIKNNF